MNPRLQPLSVLELHQQGVLFYEKDTGPVWRLVKGCMRLDRSIGSRTQLVHLALPGDWLGLDVLCGGEYQLQAQALTDCIVERAYVDAVNPQLWSKAWLQQQQRLVLMTQLRTGRIPKRLLYLLDLFNQSMNNTPFALPTLREMAEVIDATTETVCRAMPKPESHPCVMQVTKRRAPCVGA